MFLLSRLFGYKPAPKASEPVLHKECRIFPSPIKEAGGYRVSARIEKDFPGGPKVHQMTRADTIPALEDANRISVSKACQAIAQLGDSLFS